MNHEYISQDLALACFEKLDRIKAKVVEMKVPSMLEKLGKEELKAIGMSDVVEWNKGWDSALREIEKALSDA